MSDLRFGGVLLVAAVAFASPFLLGLAPRLRLPSVVLEIVAGTRRWRPEGLRAGARLDPLGLVRALGRLVVGKRLRRGDVPPRRGAGDRAPGGGRRGTRCPDRTPTPGPS